MHAKISGLYPGADPASKGVTRIWTVEGLRPFVDRALEVFDPPRLMYGGDWPVSIPAGGYGSVLSGLRSTLQSLPTHVSTSIWSETARRVYGLDSAA